ncbi:PREDICTED: vacuolar protein sorting-associated protein 13C [Papilio polytes]|uniref:vacuolar protein sorting-associated protein 13C n=1 Tax=Papilio polytes TaxID=76194 RepID=UPI000675C724|nr:PREDICTED: vacuolar protein sorting-associated protein 13C [Papilio polytes]
MVFESIVVDVLNRFLGDYVENLNRSQLKLGIWGGDVVLENLILKQNALEELNIPVQTVYGHLGKLVLKIPWKNLYGASVEATIERLFLIVNPSAEIKYDPEKEEKMALASKQAELARVEEAKKKEAQKDQNKLDETFVEKLVTQIIKNVQLKITDIHIRYEDSITNPKAPFSFGITLHNLSVHTTDENWKQAVIQEAVTKIFKILDLEGLAIYWNPATELYSKSEAQDIKVRLQNEIATKSSQPSSYKYALGPINATAKLKLNPKPEGDTPKFSIPKVILSLHMEQLSVSLTKDQYQDMMLLADSMDRMSKGAPYRKYRPDVRSYKNHYKQWWHFAYTCILEDEVRRRRRNWEWTHMLNHRRLCKDYASAYQCKLTNKGKVSTEQNNIICQAEKSLDLLNLVVIRQRIEMEVERLGKLEEEARKSRGWFGGWWSRGSSKDEELTEGTAIMKQFEKAMTVDEKEKLFRAIDYQEKVDVQMKSFTVSGVQQGEIVPQLVTSKEVAQDANLLNVVFETNPLDGKCDQRVQVLARPLQIVYDAQTVIEIVNVFKPPTESTALTTLQAAAGNKLSDLKEKSALGMQYAVHHHTFIDLDIDIAASYIIVPQTGIYRGDEACVVVKHSAFTSNKVTIVIACAQEEWQTAIGSDVGTPLHLLQPTNLTIQIHKCLITDDPRMPKIKVRGELEKIAISVSEDRLLTLCEILVSMPLPQSEETTQLKIFCYKFAYTVSGQVLDYPLFGDPRTDPIAASDSKASSLSLLKYLDPAEKQKRDTARSKQRKTDEQSVQLTEVEAFFIMKELILSVNRKISAQSRGYDKFLVFSLQLLELTATQKTFTLEATVRLGAVNMQHHRTGHRIINMIETPEVPDVTDAALTNQYLFAVTYRNVDKKCPEFRSHYGSIEQLIELDFTTLKLLLHLQGLQEILIIANEYQTRLQNIQSKVDRYANAGPLETIMEDEEFSVAKSKASVSKPARRKQIESIQLKVNVKIGAVEIGFATERRPLAALRLQGAGAGLVLKPSYTQLDCAVASIKVEDLNPETIHREILKVLGGDVINVQIVMYNLEQYPNVSDVNMSIDAQINCLRIVFLNWFVTSMLEFLNNFQTAQQAIIEASSQAADAARANVQTAYQNLTKLSLKVRLAAPIILVPENSASRRAVLVDLGRMTLNNKFVDLPVADVSNKVTVDELMLELEDMKLSCVELRAEQLDVLHERKLLRPTSFKLFVKRSLSQWYDTLPDLDISGRMNTIAITVGHSDYKSIMKILNQNLQEGQTKTEDTKAAQTMPKATSKVGVKIQVSKAQVKSMSAPVTPVEDKKPRTTIKFAFTMDSFVIDLLNTTASVENPSNSLDVDLARFCLALLSVKGRMFSDGSLHTSVLLVDCTLDDTRPGRGAKITRYLERRRDNQEALLERTQESTAIMEANDKIRSMIDITYTMKNSDTFIDMRIFSFNLILAMDFLNKIAEFMTTGLAEDAPDAADLKLRPNADKSTDNATLQRRKTMTSTVAVEPAQKPSMMTVNIKIEQPDIILVESLEQKQCDALVLNLYMESTWAMQVSYYNIGRAVWEPLIEPVEVLKDSQYRHVPWELKMEVVMRPQEAHTAIDTTDEAANLAVVAQRQANKTITISSSEPLEITITRTGMEVLTQLGNSFAAAVATEADTTIVAKAKVDDITKKEYLGAPYVLHNCIGLTAKLLLQNNKDFSVFLTDEHKSSDYREVVLEPGACVPLQLKHGGLNLMKLNEPPPPLKLNVKIVELEEEVIIPVERADKRYFALGRRHSASRGASGAGAGTLEKHVPHAAAVEPRGLISDVVMQDAALHIYMRSIVQVINSLSVNVSVYYMTLSGNEVRLLGEVKPAGVLRLPLQAVHTPTAELFFSVEGFTVSVSPFIWRELQNEVTITKLLQCDSKDKTSGEKFYLKAVGSMEQVFFEHSNRHTFASSCYEVVLKPAVKLQNCLPVDIIVSQLGLKRTQVFKPGEMFHLSHLAPNRASIVVMIQSYLDKCWVCTKNLPDEETELSVWSFESHDSPAVMTLDLGVHSSDSEGTQVLSLYCPFWMLNKTGFTLCYRKSKKPEKDSSSPNKIANSRCCDLVKRHSSCSNADEMGNVIFHPKDYKEPILFSFRAKNFFGKKKAAIRVEFGEWSDKFSLDVPGSSGVVVCRNEGRTYQVAVTNQLTFNSLTKMVIFTPFFLIINEAPFAIQYQELHRSGDPWREVAEKSSSALWPVVEREDKLLLLRVAGSAEHAAPFLYTEQHTVCLKLNNEYGGLHVEVQLSEGGTYVTVRQYRDGHAPALLVNFSPHPIVVYERENVNVKKIPPMHRMLFTWDNPAGPRILVFEGHKKSEIYNDLRKDGIGEFMINETERMSWVSFLDGLQRVVLVTGDALLAAGAHTLGEAEPLRTELVLAMHGLGLSLVNDTEALEIVYVSISNSGKEAYQRYITEKMVSDEPVPCRILIDEKMEIGMKPFIEVSIVERIMEHSKVRQYKYYKVLIQEFHVKVDMGLINALMGMFPQRLLTEQEALEAFQLDMERAGQPLEALAALGAASDQKNFYDNLHLSPLKVHVSFSLGGATQLPTFVGTLLQSIGVTLTDMNDVVFKLSYYERNYEFLSQKELISQVQSHYTGQALKQLYVLVLGLDVIGNPYGLVIGLKKGVEDLFYEPFQGAIQGPGEFAEGLMLGVRSLVGHTVGGAYHSFVVSACVIQSARYGRAADLSEEVRKRRAARYLPPDAGVRPYSRLQAEGYKMLSELEKGKFVSTDTYEAHVWVIAGKEAVMCTDKRLLYLERNNVFGGWQIVWTYLWSEIPEIPTAVSKGVYIPTAKKKVLGMFSSSGSGKVIFLYDEQQKRYLLAQCERLMRAPR